MILRSKIGIIIIFLASSLLTPILLPAQIPDGFCVSQQEYSLYRKINDYRNSKGLQVIPISRSLCYVAKLHVIDLTDNHPDTSFCNLNSWSDKGPWKPCCHSKYKPVPDCILNKPAELTKYTGQAHELCYYDSQAIQTDTVFSFWMRVEQARDILINNRKWSLFTWQAMGVGIYKQYACVWLGEMKDTVNEPTICQGEVNIKQLTASARQGMSQVISSPAGRMYLIFGSFKTEEEALKAVKKFHGDGFYQSKVIFKDNTYRVSLSDHATMQEAQDAKKRLGAEYKEAWILKF